MDRNPPSANYAQWSLYQSRRWSEESWEKIKFWREFFQFVLSLWFCFKESSRWCFSAPNLSLNILTDESFCTQTTSPFARSWTLCLQLICLDLTDTWMHVGALQLEFNSAYLCLRAAKTLIIFEELKSVHAEKLWETAHREKALHFVYICETQPQLHWQGHGVRRI